MTPDRLAQIVRLFSRIRIGIYVLLAVLVAVFVFRYDLVLLPAQGCSPLVGFEPGERLVVERRLLGTPAEGEVLLFRDGGELLLGRVAAPPASAPLDVWAAVEEGALWLVTERPECPGRDSRVLGPIPRAAWWGRVTMRVPW